jgi:ATP-binding cassette subfamily C (CFTR/MRP) protein 1
MTERGHDREKEFEGALAEDPAVAAENTNHEEPLDEDNDENEEKEYVQIATHGGSGSGSDLGIEKKYQQPDVSRTKSYATDASVVTGTESHVEEPKKSWYKQLNPMRWGEIPPVPETRGVSKEYTASFLSLVYFQWMSPVMAASTLTLLLKSYILTIYRLATNDNLNKMIFGQSTQTEPQRL